MARHPFLPAMQRDQALGLSRHKGATLRQRLLEEGYLKLHKVGTGTRSGQLVLLETTPAGDELLASLKIRVQKPRGRGGFRHKYYCHQLGRFARATWPGSVVEIEDGSLGKFADVTVRMPPESGREPARVIAFEVYVTGEAKELRGISKGVQVFDQVIVCAENQAALDSLQQKAGTALPADHLEKVRFHPIARYLSQTGGTPASRGDPLAAESSRAGGRGTGRRQLLFPGQGKIGNRTS